MIDFITAIQSIGDQVLEFILFPLLIWTAIALPIAFCLHYWDAVPPVVHYHARIALLITLPLGIAGTYLFDVISSTATATGTAALIVIQNPISVSVSEAGPSILHSVSDPVFWIGVLSLFLAFGILWMLFKIVLNYLQLKRMQHRLNFVPLAQNRELISTLPNIPRSAEHTLVAFSDEIKIPFTFGWKTTRIVIPSDLKEDSDALAMAVQHELIHIKNHDFLLNSLFTLIKALFWFHPLVHYLYNSGREYREITCDGEVLAENQFSKKRYASLLFELAKREHRKNVAISMAVNPSSLKKRIQIMSSSTNVPTTFRSSFFLTLFSAALMVIAISCTDMSEDGITKSEFEQTQEQMATAPPPPEAPLYIINGEEWEYSEETAQKLSRLKSKYIESIDILKGEKARSAYGEKGENGVLKMTVHTPEKAFEDLKEVDSMTKTPAPPSSPSKADNGDYYVAVEDMPELKGGLTGLQQKITYPEKAHEEGVQGKVIVQFIVDEQGNVENPQVIKGIGAGCDEEALRVVKEAQFEPGTSQGEPVRVQYSLPISYRLAAGDEG